MDCPVPETQPGCTWTADLFALAIKFLWHKQEARRF